MDLHDKAAFADKLRKLSMDGSKRFEGFQYDVEADIEKFVAIAQQVGATDQTNAAGSSLAVPVIVHRLQSRGKT